MKTAIRLAGAALVLLACAWPVAAQDAVAAARDLYGSAAYEEALALLDRAKEGGQPGDVRAVEQYRALCLLALGRQAEAERAIEMLYAADPGYRVDAAASPRVQSAFSTVRRRVMPSLVQQRYLHAKGAYDRKEYESAIAQFDATLALLEMPEVIEGREATFADMRTLITGFRDLARAALPPPPPPKPVAAPPPPPPPPARKPFYTADDLDVTPPAAVNQKMPRWEGPAAQAVRGMRRTGVIEVTVGESGAVEAVVMRQPTSTIYDDLLLAEARKWQYTPAKAKDGAPVKYRKMIQFTLQ